MYVALWLEVPSATEEGQEILEVERSWITSIERPENTILFVITRSIYHIWTRKDDK
jgi:hypothetical protein